MVCKDDIRTNKKPEKPRRAAARRERRLDPRRGRPARAGALRRAHGVQRHEEFRQAGDRRVPGVDRHAVRADVNAYTSFDETVYMLQVPTDKPDVPRDSVADPRGLGARRHRSIPPEIDKERGVIVEEWRTRARRRRADRRTSSFPCCSRARGTPSDCRSARRDASRRSSTTRCTQFYTDWYRPDLMAVVAVGDFDEAGGRIADQETLRRRCRPRARRSRDRPIRCPTTRARSTRSRPTRKPRRQT